MYFVIPENKSWSKLEGEGMKPSPRDKLQAVAVSTDIYFFGGFGPKSESLDEEVTFTEIFGNYSIVVEMTCAVLLIDP